MHPSTNWYRSTEQQLFAQILMKHMARPTAPLLLEGGTGLGKTRAILHAISNTSARIALVLPTHELMDQLLKSKDLSAIGLAVVDFRPRMMFDTEADYQAQRLQAKDARVMLCTAASVIIDQRLAGDYNGATAREVLLFDEADQLPDMAALQSNFTIPAAALQGKPIAAGLAALAKAGREVAPETRAMAQIMTELLQNPVGYASVGLDEDGNAKLHHHLPGRLLKKLVNRPSSILVSATLSIRGGFSDFCRAMGIDAHSQDSRMIEPQRHGEVNFVVSPSEVDSDEWVANIVKTASQASKPVLIATTSHETTQRLQAAMGKIEGVLIKAAAWAGLDLASPPRTIIVPRIPFSQPVVIDSEVKTSYLSARSTAERRLRQVLGRGLRSPEAKVSLHIMDARMSGLSGFVPQRFKHAWPDMVEGERQELILSKAERDPGLRKAALTLYGARCMAEGCHENQLHRLDIHHKDPISEGIRRTRPEDVMVLCKNHHADAHFELKNGKNLDENL